MHNYLENLNQEQLQAVLSNDNEIMLVAGAGKTNTIVKKIIYLIKEQRKNSKKEHKTIRAG